MSATVSSAPAATESDAPALSPELMKLIDSRRVQAWRKGHPGLEVQFVYLLAEIQFPKEKGGKVQVPIGEYEKNLDRLVARLKKTRARLVWRNTTPVPPGSKGRHVGDSIKYNAAAARVMIRHGIPTHDLFTMSKERMKEIMLPANVHYTREGSEVLGGDVAKVILEALK